MIRTLFVETPDSRTLRVVDGGDPSGWPIVMHSGTPVSGDLYPPLEQYSAENGIRLIG